MKAGFDVGLAAEVAQGEWAIKEGMATALPLSLALWAVILWAVILWAVILWAVILWAVILWAVILWLVR